MRAAVVTAQTLWHTFKLKPEGLTLNLTLWHTFKLKPEGLTLKLTLWHSPQSAMLSMAPVPGSKACVAPM